MDPADYFTSGVTEALKEEQPFTTWYTIQSVSTACHMNSMLNRQMLMVQQPDYIFREHNHDPVQSSNIARSFSSLTQRRPDNPTVLSPHCC